MEKFDIAKVEQATLDKADGLIGHLNSLSVDEAKIAFDKQDDDMKKVVAYRRLQLSGIDPEFLYGKTQEVVPQVVPVVTSTVASEPSAINEDAIVEKLLAKMNERVSTETMQSRQKEADAIMSAYFGDKLEEFVKSDVGQVFVGAINGMAQKGVDPVDAVNKAFASMSSIGNIASMRITEPPLIPVKENETMQEKLIRMQLESLVGKK